MTRAHRAAADPCAGPGTLQRPRSPRNWPGFPGQRPGLAVLVAGAIGLGACANTPPTPDWQLNAHDSLARAMQAQLSGDTRVAELEFDRARADVARTGRADLLARVELSRCAARIAGLAFEPCAGFERLRADAPAPERAYADYLQGRIEAARVALLPAAHQGLASLPRADGAAAPAAPAVAAALVALAAPAAPAAPVALAALATPAATPAADIARLQAVADPLTRLVGAALWLQAGVASPAVLELAVETASAQGWRRPLLAWLGMQARRAELAGDTASLERLRRRMGWVLGDDAAPRR